jgi:hypothetical protein
MDAILIAALALVGSVLSTVGLVFGSPAYQARTEARKVLETYREPLLAASYELQARLHNILRNEFLAVYVTGDKAGRADAAIQSTLYVFAQFLGWREIIRREVQLLRFPRGRQTRAVTRLLGQITDTFLSDQYGPQFMLWRVEQRGIGERLIVSTASGKQTCMGYATFVAQRETLSEWLEPLECDLRQVDADGRRRLIELQHRLLELVRQLDESRTRYPYELEMA